MKKSKGIIIGAVIAVLIATGAYAYAQTNENQNAQPKMVGKMVEEGIITQEQADKMHEFGQNYMQEHRKEMMENRLNKAVEEGVITSDEANQIREWFKNMPEAMAKLKPMKMMREAMMD